MRQKTAGLVERYVAVGDQKSKLKPEISEDAPERPTNRTKVELVSAETNLIETGELPAGQNALTSVADAIAPQENINELGLVTSEPVPFSDHTAPAGDNKVPVGDHTHAPAEVSLAVDGAMTETSVKPFELSKTGIGTSQSIAKQISEVVVPEVATESVIGSQNENTKKITLKLYPKELGQLTLHIGMENETVKAQIIATELATSELLNRDKGVLMDALHENGLELGSFEVSYGGADAQQENQEQGRIEKTSRRVGHRIRFIAIN